MILTAVTMVVEIVTGWLFGSMALLADGWHITTHVAAFSITLFTYHYARKNLDNPKYTFGTGKVSVLGGLAVAFIGLTVNIISAWLLRNAHDHHRDGNHYHDHNLQAAYLHVLADALTSVLAMVGLCGGKFWGLIWMDAVMGLVGAAVITRWAYNLIKDTSGILLDSAVDQQTQLNVMNTIEADADTRVADLHLWHLSQDPVAAIISVVTHYPRSPEYYKIFFQDIPSLPHVSIEVNPCEGEPCLPVATRRYHSYS